MSTHKAPRDITLAGGWTPQRCIAVALTLVALALFVAALAYPWLRGREGAAFLTDVFVAIGIAIFGVGALGAAYMTYNPWTSR